MTTFRRNKIRQIRVNTEEDEQLEKLARMNGFATVSEYIRSVTLGQDLHMRKMLQELHTKVVRGEGI